MKIFFRLLIFCIGFIFLSLANTNNALAVNECSQTFIDPATTIIQGTIITFRASGCPPSNSGYQVRIQSGGTPLITVDMVDLTTDKSQYSATIPQSAQLELGNYTIALIDKASGDPITFSGLIVGSDTPLSDIEAEATLDSNRNLAICIGGFNSANSLHSTVVRIACTRATPLHLCPLPQQLSYYDVQASDPDENGKIFGCKTLQGLNSDVTQVNLDFFQGPTKIYSLVVDTTRGRESYLCYPNGNTEFDGIQTAIGCVPIDTDSANSINDTIAFFVRWSIGIAGGIAMLLLIAGSYQVITSQGDKYKLQSGKDIILAALSGIILAIFAIFLLRLLGQNILNLF